MNCKKGKENKHGKRKEGAKAEGTRSLSGVNQQWPKDSCGIMLRHPCRSTVFQCFHLGLVTFAENCCSYNYSWKDFLFVLITQLLIKEIKGLSLLNHKNRSYATLWFHFRQTRTLKQGSAYSSLKLRPDFQRSWLVKKKGISTLQRITSLWQSLLHWNNTSSFSIPLSLPLVSVFNVNRHVLTYFKY